MLNPEDFKTKYQTKLAQIHEESFLDTISEEDREIYTDAEILTGKNTNGKINKFNNFGRKNKGKKYQTVRLKTISSFKKFIDGKITHDEMDDIWEKLWLSSKRGNFNFMKLLLERTMGKEQENINIKTEEPITFTLDIDDNSKNRQKKNKKDKK